MENTTKLTIGIIILLASAGSIYTIADAIYVNNDLGNFTFLPHQCEDSITYCHKLSAINSNELQTRCYNNPEALRRYKFCTTGWTLYRDMNETIGNEIETINHDDFEITSEFKTIKEAQDYIKDYKSDLSMNISIDKRVIAPNFQSTEVFWTASLYKPSGNITKVVYSEQLTTVVENTLSSEDTDALVQIHAESWYDRWMPKVEIVYES